MGVVAPGILRNHYYGYIMYANINFSYLIFLIIIKTVVISSMQQMNLDRSKPITWRQSLAITQEWIHFSIFDSC